MFVGCGVLTHLCPASGTRASRRSSEDRSWDRCSLRTRAATRATTARMREVRSRLPPPRFKRSNVAVREESALGTGLTRSKQPAFLSYLRLSVYMAVVSVAITLSFHLKSEPSRIERRMAKPLGAVFWLLAVATLFVGLGNYISESFASSPPSPSPRSCDIWVRKAHGRRDER